MNEKDDYLWNRLKDDWTGRKFKCVFVYEPYANFVVTKDLGDGNIELDNCHITSKISVLKDLKSGEIREIQG